MECPFRLIAWASLDQQSRDRGNWIDTTCGQGNCPLWNSSLGQCGLVAQAYLTGLEAERKETSIGKGNNEQK